MPRRSNDLPDLDFLARYLAKPFVSPNWAVGFVAIGAVFTVCHALFVGDPAAAVPTDPMQMLTRQFQVLLWFRFMIPAGLFSTIGMAGLITCLVRDWLQQRAE